MHFMKNLPPLLVGISTRAEFREVESVRLEELEGGTSGWRPGERGSRASGTLLGFGGGLGHSWLSEPRMAWPGNTWTILWYLSDILDCLLLEPKLMNHCSEPLIFNLQKILYLRHLSRLCDSEPYKATVCLLFTLNMRESTWGQDYIWQE